MSQLIEELNISTTKEKFINITDQIFDILTKCKLKNGLLNLTRSMNLKQIDPYHKNLKITN